MPIRVSQLPGPRALPLIGNLHQVKVDRLHQYLEQWSEEYGEVYKMHIGPFKVAIITDPEITQVILRERPHAFKRMKKIDTVLQEDDVHGVFNAEGEDWALHRKMVAKGLDVKHQKQYFPQMERTLEKLYKKWSNDAEKGHEVNVQQDLLRFTVDVTTSLAFGYEMNTLEEQGGVIQDHLEKVFPTIFKRINDPFPWHKIYKTKKDRIYDAAITEIEKLVLDFIAKGRERLQARPELRERPENIMDALLTAAEEEPNFGDREVKGNLLTLLLAGEDTTAHTLAWSLVLLAQHPEKQELLHQEALAVLGERAYMNVYEEHTQFAFTEGVAQETMRIKPVAPLLIFEPIEDIEIKGYLFKKGSRMLVETRVAAMKDKYFTDAESFMPERWMKQSRCPMHSIDAYIPFGGGPRFCPGKNLAMLEIKMVLSMLFKNFEMELLTPVEEIDEIMAFTMMASDFRIRLKKRTQN